MIISTEKIKDVCSKILVASDYNEISPITATLEIKASDKKMSISVTNREYFTEVSIDLDASVEFHATVNANLFLKLVSQITTDSMELNVDGNVLVVKGNGTYKLPIIFDGEEILTLPVIDIVNETSSFDINTEILTNIMNYNSKELNKGVFQRPVQKMYYIDDEGCITFTTGACVNVFHLDTPIKILLNSRIVKMFRLFKDDVVHFSLGKDMADNNMIVTKVRFKSDDVTITAIISSDDNLINSVPAKAIRGRALNEYKNSVVVDKEQFIQSINRLLIFKDSKNALNHYSVFEFGNDSVTVSDKEKNNKETIKYENEVTSLSTIYKAVLDLNDLKTTLENCKEQYITICFGDGQAFVIKRDNIYNVIPECSEI